MVSESSLISGGEMMVLKVSLLIDSPIMCKQSAEMTFTGTLIRLF